MFLCMYIYVYVYVYVIVNLWQEGLIFKRKKESRGLATEIANMSMDDVAEAVTDNNMIH